MEIQAWDSRPQRYVQDIFLRIHSNFDIRCNQSLLQHNAKVYIGARSQGKAEEAIKNLKELTGKEALFLKLDLGDLKAVKAAAEEFTRYDLWYTYSNIHSFSGTVKKRSCISYIIMGAPTSQELT